MRTFAYLMHPLNMHQVKVFWPITRLLPPSFINPFLKQQALKIVPIKKICSRQHKEVEGFAIICPVHPEEMLKQDDEAILDMIISAGLLSEKLGFRLLGLAGYFGVVADRKPMLYRHMKTAITSGAAFSAWTAYEAAFKATRKNKVDMKKAVLTVVSPANSVGTLCSRKFAENVGRIVLTGDTAEKLEKVRQLIQAGTLIHVDIEEDLAKAAAQADIIVNANTQNKDGFDAGWLKPGSIVCDISTFQHVAEKTVKRPDVTTIDCKLISLPLNASLGAELDLPQHTICPVLAETMLLALEENFANFSLGESVNPDKLDYIANVASRHGFEVSVPGAEIN
jgi:predicted amino acid dehydrogenase